MSASTPHPPENGPDLRQKVDDWLLHEGYSLEFRVANAFTRHGFHVRQGQYVHEDLDSAPREIDVEAEMQFAVGEQMLRLTHVIECKWSKEKPWVVFSSTDSRIAASACVAQSIASKLGQTALWCIAGDKRLHELSLFDAPRRPGFGSRVAFSSGQDNSYSAIQSVIGNAVRRTARYDDHGATMRFAAVAVPTIVVDGKLFECFFDSSTGHVSTQPVDRCRLHYRGSRNWGHHATIDIVTVEIIEEFAAQRSQEVSKALAIIGDAVRDVETAIRTGTLAQLKVTDGGRGIVGLPPLLRGLGTNTPPLPNPTGDGTNWCRGCSL